MAGSRGPHHAIQEFSIHLYPQRINASELINVLYNNNKNNNNKYGSVFVQSNTGKFCFL